LNGGIGAGPPAAGSYVIGSDMSPFEAFLAAKHLIFQKTFKDPDLRPASQEQASTSRQIQTSPTIARPKLTLRTRNPRQVEFLAKLNDAAKKYSTLPAAQQAIENTLEQSRVDSLIKQDINTNSAG
jgi:hypothetical protein